MDAKELLSIPITTITGEQTTLAQYKDKVILIVNVASRCGFTPQYVGLEQLHQLYGSQGLVVLGFPCNQFAGQEPETESKILDFCMINYGVSFQLFSKIDVNGENEHPLYAYLKELAPGILGSKAIKWNFTKFLIGKDLSVQRFAPNVAPETLVPEIEKLLAA